MTCSLWSLGFRRCGGLRAGCEGCATIKSPGWAGPDRGILSGTDICDWRQSKPSGRRDSNSRHLPWQGSALPLSYSRKRIHEVGMGKRGVEPLRLAALVPKTSVSAIPPLARAQNQGTGSIDTISQPRTIVKRRQAKSRSLGARRHQVCDAGSRTAANCRRSGHLGVARARIPLGKRRP
jgi:hypothetical protein